MPSPAETIAARNSVEQQKRGIDPLSSVTDRELVEVLVSHGQPRWAARELERNPQLRLAALLFWADVQNSAKGDLEARQRIDYVRECWTRMRQEELISDDPRRGHTEVFDPKELL